MFPDCFRRFLCAAGFALQWLVGLMVVQPDCGWAEDALIEGGLSPNKRYEVRMVRVTDGPLKGSYELQLFDARSNEFLSPLRKGGHFAYDEAVAGACSATWHPSARYVAVLNVETPQMTSLSLFVVDQDLARELKMPDYALLALGKIKEGKRGFYDGPTVRWPEWIGNDLHFRVSFRVPPPKKTEGQLPTEYTASVIVTPGSPDTRYEAELKKLSHPLRPVGPEN
jgi:hypothetical protein